MRLNIQSRIWPLLTLPVLLACLLLGSSLVMSINTSRKASLGWARCEADLHDFGGTLWSYHSAFRAGDKARAAISGMAVTAALARVPDNCIAPEERERLSSETERWLQETRRELEAHPEATAALSEASFNSVLQQFDVLSLRSARMKTEALSGPLAKWKDAVELSLLASLLAVMALMLNRTYRRELLQRLAVEAELRESEARYRGLFEHVAEGVYQTSASGKILRANPALVRMLGFDSEQALMQVEVGRDLYFDPERRRELTAQLERDGYLHEVEFALRRRDGSVLVVLENARAVRGPAGELRWYEGSLVDITRRKQAENELAAQMRALELARKQSESQAYQLLEQSFELAQARDQALQAARRKLEFLVNLSSEFRGPMNGVMGMAQLLLDSELSAQQREFAESVRRSSGRLIRTIDEILEYSRIDGGEVFFQKAEFSLRALLADLVSRQGERAEQKGIELATLVKADVPDRLVGDENRLRQVLSHLIQNAIRMTDAGTVSVTVNVLGRNGAEAVLRVQVEDSGSGIPTEVMPTLFDPFAGSGKPRGRAADGGGLALAISRRLVERMDGQMGVESEPGQGSLFWFQVSLPYIEGTAQERVEGLSGLRCLIVQDSVCSRGVIAEIMTGWGMHAVTAGDGQDALAAMRQAELLEEPFDLLLVDQDLPGMSGVALADAAIEDAGCGRPAVILMVPYSQRAFLTEPTMIGISAVLAKPVEERALLATVLRACAKPHLVRHSLLQLDEAVKGERQRSLLLVEDDPIGQRVGKRLLEKLGYEVVVVNNGLEAVQAVQEYQFAAVLMDMMMPEMDGCTAAQAIRRLDSVDTGLPIIAMTASDATSDRERCLASGMNDYICKPATIDQLRTVVGRWTGLKAETAKA